MNRVLEIQGRDDLMPIARLRKLEKIKKRNAYEDELNTLATSVILTKPLILAEGGFTVIDVNRSTVGRTNDNRKGKLPTFENSNRGLRMCIQRRRPPFFAWKTK